MTLGEIRKIYVDALCIIYNRSEAVHISKIFFEEVLKLNSLHQSLQTHLLLTVEQKEVLLEYLERLKKQEPFQYILCYELFYGLTFNVNKSVLIPRPETEELVRWIVENEKTAKTILDIGTGSGCIAISLAHSLSGAKVDAIDISNEAIVVAQQNAVINKVEVNFIELDILQNKPLKQYDIIVSNPPYIGEDEKTLMDNNVLLYEPHIALFPKDDVLLFYKRISVIAQTNLTSNGRIYFEINEHYATEVVSILRKDGFQNIEVMKDLSGKERMVRAEKSFRA